MVAATALERLLDRDPEAQQATERDEFARLSRNRPLVLMGAGGLGQRTLRGLRTAGVEPLAFADNSPQRQGTIIDGLRVLAPADAAREFGATAAFVITIWGANSTHRVSHSRGQLSTLGCDVVVSFPPLYWAHAAALLPHYLQDLPHRVLDQKAEVRRAFDLWEDDASRAEYVAQVRFRLDADFDGLAGPVAHPAYFPGDLYDWSDQEWIVDGGAYDGDTLRSLSRVHAGRFGHVLALEPDPESFGKLRATVDALAPVVRAKVECVQLALGATAGTLHIEATGTAASATSSTPTARTIAVPAAPLDDIIGAARPTVIKFDIEGAEPDALLGARQTIVQHGPVLAICVYHRQDHLWRIPLMVQAWRDDYAFFLRPHNEEGWDLVCYAIPRSRLLPKGAARTAG